MANQVQKDTLWLCIKDVTVDAGFDKDYFSIGNLYVGIDDGQMLDNFYTNTLDFEQAHWVTNDDSDSKDTFLAIHFIEVKTIEGITELMKQCLMPS